VVPPDGAAGADRSTGRRSFIRPGQIDRESARQAQAGLESIVREIGPEPERTRPRAGGPAAVAREATAAAEAIIRAEGSRSLTNQHAALCQRRGNIGPKRTSMPTLLC